MLKVKSFKVLAAMAVAFLAVVIAAYCRSAVNAVLPGFDRPERFMGVFACIGVLWILMYQFVKKEEPDVESIRTMNKSGKMTNLKSEEGQDIAEYAVMLAVILVIVVGTIRMIGSNANNVFSQVASSIEGK
jgi:Flp pilus assembly pilin Flp